MTSIVRINKSDVEYISFPKSKKLFEEYNYFIFNQGHNLSCSVTAAISMIEYLRQREGKKCQKFSVGFLYHNALVDENQDNKDNKGVIKSKSLSATTVIRSLFEKGSCLQEKWSSSNLIEIEPSHDAIIDALSRIKHSNIEILDVDILTIKYIIGFCDRPIVGIYEMDDISEFSYANSKNIIGLNQVSENVNDMKVKHSILLVGYDDDERVIYIQNSYGESWGNSGFGRISYDSLFKLKLLYSMDESCLKSL